MNMNELTASKIKEIRLHKNKTAEAVAKELDISKTAYSQLENGHVEITLNRIDALCKIFNVPITSFIPSASNTNNTTYGIGSNNIGGANNTVNNFFATPEEKLEQLAKELNDTIAEMKKNK